MQLCIPHDNINLLVLRTMARECEKQYINGSSEIEDLQKKKTGSTSIEGLPHRQFTWFADLSDFKNITKAMYNVYHLQLIDDRLTPIR